VSEARLEQFLDVAQVAEDLSVADQLFGSGRREIIRRLAARRCALQDPPASPRAVPPLPRGPAP
jgi:hypothetical protein